MVKKKDRDIVGIQKYKVGVFKSFENINDYFDRSKEILQREKVNSFFKKYVQKLIGQELLQDNLVQPSHFCEFIHDTQIKPFWNTKIQKLADKLFLPTVDNIENIQSDKVFQSNTWFKTQEYSSCNDNNYTLKSDCIKPTIKKIVKCRKIVLFFNETQRKYMREIIGTYRYFYNRCVCFFNNYDKNARKSFYYIDSLDETSKKIVTVDEDQNPYHFVTLRDKLDENYPAWILPNFPSHLITQSFREASTRFTTCLDMCKKKGIVFEFKYKTKKEKIQTINLEKEMISLNFNGIFANLYLDGYLFRNLRASEKISNFTDIKGSTLSYNKYLNKFTLNLSYVVKTRITKGKEVGAIDPGVRRFITLYSPNKVTIIGEKAIDVLFKMCKEIDIIQSRIGMKEYYIINKETNEKITRKVTSKRKRSLLKAMHRKIEKLKNMRNELHNKTIKYLCDNFKTIIVTTYRCSEMAGKLNSKTARNMYNLAYYSFKQKLIAKAKEMNVRVIDKPEYFTSKTCSKCGHVNMNLGTNEILNCSKCGLEISRDINGARCILLRNERYI